MNRRSQPVIARALWWSLATSLVVSCVDDDEGEPECEPGSLLCPCMVGNLCALGLECAPTRNDEVSGRCRAPASQCSADPECSSESSFSACESVPLGAPFAGNEDVYVERSCDEICAERGEVSAGCDFSPPAEAEACLCGMAPSATPFSVCQSPDSCSGNPCAPDQVCDKNDYCGSGVCAPFCEADADCGEAGYCYSGRCRRNCEPDCD